MLNSTALPTPPPQSTTSSPFGMVDGAPVAPITTTGSPGLSAATSRDADPISSTIKDRRPRSPSPHAPGGGGLLAGEEAEWPAAAQAAGEEATRAGRRGCPCGGTGGAILDRERAGPRVGGVGSEWPRRPLPRGGVGAGPRRDADRP